MDMDPDPHNRCGSATLHSNVIKTWAVLIRVTRGNRNTFWDILTYFCNIFFLHFRRESWSSSGSSGPVGRVLPLY